MPRFTHTASVASEHDRSRRRVIHFPSGDLPQRRAQMQTLRLGGQRLRVQVLASTSPRSLHGSLTLTKETVFPLTR